MKTTKEELIDFLKWFHDNYDWEDDDIVVDDYLKYVESINSDLNESLSVTENVSKKPKGNEINTLLTAGNLKPILFSTPMVQAILKGEKTMTRRIIKKPAILDMISQGFINNAIMLGKYRVNDILWVRETWHPKRHNMPTGWKYEYKATAKEDGNPTDEPWKPSIFMPKEACRIFLKVTKIRVERLQDISNNDIVSEGAAAFGCVTKKLNWQHLWEKINGVESWNENPYVFVYDFERTDASFACS